MKTTVHLKNGKQIGTGAHRFHNNDNTREAIFGSFDGLTSALGVIAAAYLTGNARVLVAAACGLAIAAGVSMAGGEFLSETSNIRARCSGRVSWLLPPSSAPSCQPSRSSSWSNP